ncbi:MAG: hypothetical protein FJ267_03110 [Planctomycetes bacterium]|nr:hypothetical protein [Planctomycetota bacterium]
MFAPDDRTLLSELLEAPPGYRLEHALATTFTLDLSALMLIPLGLAGSDLSAEGLDPVAVFETVRNHSDRIDVFCQTGRIAVPHRHNPLLAFLEHSLHPVKVPSPGHLFHPKIWLLHFTTTGDEGESSSHVRLICGSRNITFDRSWDAAIALEGDTGRRNCRENSALADFVASLPSRSTHVSLARRNRIETLAEIVRKVKWSRPDGVGNVERWLTFHVLGPNSHTNVDLSGRRILAVSPFISSDGVRLLEAADELIVVGRSEELDSLDSEGRSMLSRTGVTRMVVNDSAALPDLENDEVDTRWELVGLHAKIYVIEQGHHVRVLIGSANATGAAWQGNDEILVEIVGTRKAFGIDKIIGEGRPLRKILLNHEFSDPADEDPDEKLLTKMERLLQDIAAGEFTSTIEISEEGRWTQGIVGHDQLRLTVEGTGLGVSPLSVREFQHFRDRETVNGTWTFHSIDLITPFAVLVLQLGDVQVSTVVITKLVGAPEDRLDRILAAQFKDSDSFMRLVALLLALGGDGVASLPRDSMTSGAGSNGLWGTNGSGLLELLLRAISRDPSLIDQISELVERVRSTPEGRSILPEGWDLLWQAVTVARQKAGKGR